MTNSIHLFDYWRSSASYRVRIALGIAGLDWESTEINLVEGIQRSPEHLVRNPQGLVPALEIDDKLLTQSLAIIEYIDETRKLNLIPGDALNKARVRALAYAVAMEIHPICNLRVAKHAVQVSGGNLETQEWMQHFIQVGLEDLENMLEGGDFCHGNAVTIADICLVPQIYNAIRWQVDLEQFPKIKRIYNHLNTIKAFAQAHPDQCKR